MNRFDQADDPRRRLLIEALAAGVFSAGLPGCSALAADVFGRAPAKLPPGQSVYRVSGTVTVNDKSVTPETRIRPGDTIRTEKDSELVFVVGDCSMILRSDSQVALQADKKDPSSERIAGLRVPKGKVLSVYGRGQPIQIQTVAANVQIRGTGAYLESDNEQTYFCTCYGVAEISANDDPGSKETVAASHHDKPLYILAGSGNRGNSIRLAPFVNHTDLELALIETLVGRTPAFVFPKQEYEGPRRRY